MSKEVDIPGFVAFLTNTRAESWEPFMGVMAGVGDEIWLTEIGDFGPEDEDVAELIRQGYVAGVRWSIDTEIDLSEDSAAAEEIARLVGEGFTSGFEPTWAIDIKKLSAREAYIRVDDGEVLVTIASTETNDSLQHTATVDELAGDPATAALVIEEASSPTALP